MLFLHYLTRERGPFFSVRACERASGRKKLKQKVKNTPAGMRLGTDSWYVLVEKKIRFPRVRFLGVVVVVRLLVVVDGK